MSVLPLYNNVTFLLFAKIKALLVCYYMESLQTGISVIAGVQGVGGDGRGVLYVKSTGAYW